MKSFSTMCLSVIAFCLLAVPCIAQSPPIPPAPPGFDPAAPCEELLAKIETAELGVLIGEHRVKQLGEELDAADVKGVAAYDAWMAAKITGDPKVIASALAAFQLAYDAASAIQKTLQAEQGKLAKLKIDLAGYRREYANLGC